MRNRKNGIRRLVNEKCRNVVLDLFHKAHEQAKMNLHTPVFKVMKKAAEKAFLTAEAKELLKDKMYELSEYVDFTKDLICAFIKSPGFKVPVTRFVKQQAERDIASEAKCRQDVSMVNTYQEGNNATASTDRSRSESSRASKDDKKEKKKD